MTGSATPDRTMVQDVFIRICRDTQFTIDWVRAAQITAGVFKIHPISVWAQFADMDQMQKIADGTHPVLETERGR